MGTGNADVSGSFVPETKTPDLHISIKVEGTQWPPWTISLRSTGVSTYNPVSFLFYSELIVRGDRVEGYVKPLFKDMKVVDLRSPQEKRGFFHKLYVAGVKGQPPKSSRTGPGRKLRPRSTSPGPWRTRRRARCRLSAIRSRTPFSKPSSPRSKGKPSRPKDEGGLVLHPPHVNIGGDSATQQTPDLRAISDGSNACQYFLGLRHIALRLSLSLLLFVCLYACLDRPRDEAFLLVDKALTFLQGRRHRFLELSIVISSLPFHSLS